jgi:hypothetical protein
MGLGRAIKTALNLRDESEHKAGARAPKETEAPATAVSEAPAPVTSEEINQELARLASTAQFIRQLYLVDRTGRTLGVARAERALQDPPVDLRPVLESLAGVNLGGQLKRVFLDGDNGIAVLLRIAENRWLIGMCEKGASLGTVSIGVGKLLATLIPPHTNGKPAGSASHA